MSRFTSRKEPPGTVLQAMYDAMFAAIGPLGWWPGRTRFEVCVGAILTQNTAWRNVTRAIGNLKRARVLTPRAMHDIPQQELAALIVPSGYYNMKAGKLKNFVNMLFDNHGGSLDRLFARDRMELREILLDVKGIGRETADSMILYAAGKPIFVIDAYTRRILSRHGVARADADYDALRLLFEDNLPTDVQMFNEYHALIVFVGHHYCRKTPQCNACPLQILLPPGGPAA